MNFIFFSLLDRRPLGLLGCRQCFRPPSHHFGPCSGPWQRHHQVWPSWWKLCLLRRWRTRIRRHHSRRSTRPYPGRSLSPRCCHSLLRLPVCWLPICRPIRRSRCRRCQSWSTSFGCINKIFHDVKSRLIMLIEMFKYTLIVIPKHHFCLFHRILFHITVYKVKIALCR